VRLLRRILVTIVVTLAVLYACLYYAAPIALSFYSARKAPPIIRIVPTDLEDLTISQSAGTRLSYVGYAFEVPWTDLDESKTKLFPEDKPEKTRVVLSFHSGLVLAVKALPAHEFASGFTTGDIGIKVSPVAFEAAFGHEAILSDYAFTKCIFDFTPDKMHHWAQSHVFAREESLLVIKSMMVLKPAETGIFNIRTSASRGFQQGNPRIRQDWLVASLYPYSEGGGVEIGFFQKDYASSTGVTQPEINRIVQSLHKITPGDSVAQR
jgi:hypothetical protein